MTQGAIPPAQQPRPSQTTLKTKAITWIINRIVDVSNRRVNIRDLQKKYKAEEGRILEMHVRDLRKKYYLRVMNGRIEYMDKINPDDLAGGFETSSDSLINLARGVRQRMNPATDEIYEESYTPFDAITHGDIRFWGDAASNDALLFAKAVSEDVYPQLQKELKSGLKK